MTGRFWKRWIATTLCVILALPACTTLRDVPMPVTTAASRAPSVHAGEVVRVTLRDGQKKQFTITAVTSDALLGKDVQVPFEEIQNLQRRERSGWRNTLLVGAGAAVVVAGLLVYAIIKGAEGSD